MVAATTVSQTLTNARASLHDIVHYNSPQKYILLTLYMGHVETYNAYYQ